MTYYVPLRLNFWRSFDINFPIRFAGIEGEPHCVGALLVYDTREAAVEAWPDSKVFAIEASEPGDQP